MDRQRERHMALALIKNNVHVAMTAARVILGRFKPGNARLIERYFTAGVSRKLQLGSGEHILEGWLNTDIRPLQDVVYLDVTRQFNFEDGSFDYVFSEHLIEHIPFSMGMHMLRECFRVLRPSGRLRIATPDFAFLKQLHVAEKSELQRAYIDWAVKNWLGTVPPDAEMFVINNFFYNWGHQFIYDERTLAGALAAAGYVHIRRYEVNTSDDAALCGLENERRIPDGFLRLETLVLEGMKPAR